MRRAATLTVLALAAALALTGCSDDETDANPCGSTGKPQFDNGAAGSFDGVHEAFIVPLKGGGGGSAGGGGGKGGGGVSSGGSKGGTSGGTAKGGAAVGSKAATGTSAFSGSKATGSRTFTAPSGTKYAVASRVAIPRTAPPRPYAAGYVPPAPLMVPYYPIHSPYLWWALYGNYPGATTIIECR